MARFIYTDEQLDWLRKFAQGKFLKDILPVFNERFGLALTEKKLKSLMGNHKITNGMFHKHNPKSAHKLTTPEMDKAVLKKFHQKGEGSYVAIQTFLLERFGLELTIAQIKGYANRIHLNMMVYGRFQKGHVPANKGKKTPTDIYTKCQRTMFKKGHIPHNWKPVGSERVSVDGYTEIKVREPNVWMLKHRLVYEEATGEKLGKEDKIIFLDGDPKNIVPENLAKVSPADLARLNQMHLLNGDIEAGKVGVLIAKLSTMVHKRERGDKL